MTAEYVQRVIDLLWPEGDGSEAAPVFALLDGARDPRIEPMVRFSKRQYRCLYSGNLSPALTAAAPYVVFLARDGQFTRELIESAWGNSWGVFLVGENDCTHEQVRRHFRRYLKVKDEDGRTFLFRFYDPRVLPHYLGACNSIETAEFYGPVVRFVFENGAGAPMVLEHQRPGVPKAAPARPAQSAAARAPSIT